MRYFDEQTGTSPEKALAAFREGLRKARIPHPILECRLGRPLIIMGYGADYMERVKLNTKRYKISDGTVDYVVIKNGGIDGEDNYIFICQGRG